ncbi:MAG: pilus assembly protein [Gammaproteobacteria bacterium]|nr:pilus assembly protein [Gammaproteobacteria bacterium]
MYFKKQNSSAHLLGQTLVEFALILPILLALMVGTIELGVIMYTQIVVTNAVWEGARAGAVITDPSQGDAQIIGAINRAAYGLDTSRLIIEISPSQDEPPRNLPYPEPRGAPLTVKVTYPLHLALPPMDLNISAQATTIMEYQNP